MCSQIKVLLLDIEGTITSISFVKDVLFPYAADYVDSFLRSRIPTLIGPNTSLREEDQKLLNAVRELSKLSNARQDDETKIQPIESIESDDLPEKLAANVREWIRLDKKITPLKTLQGLIWQDGYEQGTIVSRLYDDVVDFFCSEKFKQVPIFIFSSGSILAQQLLFKHTQIGDLTHRISGYFDTFTGPKCESESYRKIAGRTAQICPDVHPQNILFLTDIEMEALAAREACFEVALVVRPGNTPLSEDAKSRFRQIETFSNIHADLSTT